MASSSSGPCGVMDIALVLDTSGSMSSAINSVKTGIESILDTIEEASGEDYRLALVQFPGDTITVSLNFSPNNRAAFSTALNGMSANGGDNEPEASDEALHTVISALASADRPSGLQIGDFTPAFRPGALKIIILVTDARPGGFSDNFVAGVDDVRAHGYAVLAADDGILISAVYTPIVSVHAEVAEIMQDYATTTGGAYVQAIGGIGTGNALQSIIEACGGSVSSSTSTSSSTSESESSSEEDCGILQRPMSNALRTALQSSAFKRVYLWKVKPLNRPIMAFTSLDTDVVYNDGDGSLTYRSGGNASATEFECEMSLSISGVDVTAMRGTEDAALLPGLPMYGITREQVESGAFQDAKTKVMLADWSNLAAGHVTLFTGRLGKHQINDSTVRIELTNKAEILNRNYGRVTSKNMCALVREFGEDRCRNVRGYDDGPRIGLRIQSGTITTIVTPSHLVIGGITKPAGWASNGKLIIDGGDYDGIDFTINVWEANGTHVWLTNPILLPVSAGQAIKVKEGCLGTYDACRSKVPVAGEIDRQADAADNGNAVNFYGQPNLPSEDEVTRQHS